MINLETILSIYDDKPTLMQWLKKVEKALKDASATAFVVNKKGNATISFSILFDDGTKLESGDIVLQQGESVASAAIVDGELILTLTNGEELNAGNLGGVSSFEINASQHLIVTYQNGTTQDLGAIFNGNVNIAGSLTADSIIESMSGYSFTKVDDSTSWDKDYVGCVKNGNKITFVLFGHFTADAANSDGVIGRFTIPSSVGSKLFPYTVGGVSGRLAQGMLPMFFSINNSIDTRYDFAKSSNVLVSVALRNVSALTPGTQYFFRIEQTFLLSDGL